MTFSYELTKTEWQAVGQYALDSFKYHNHRANRTNIERTEELVKSQIAMGKTAEIAFEHLSQALGIGVKAQMIASAEGDSGDFIINGRGIEIKTTKSTYNFFMLEPIDLCYHLQKKHSFPSVFILGLNEWNDQKQRPTRKVTLAGYIFNYELFEKGRLLRAGEKIPHTNTILNQDNFVVPIGELRTDWNKMFNFLLEP
jgi:hypothetical protein